MIKVICTIFTIVIKDMKMRLGNLYLLLGKSAMWFEPLAQTVETDKKKASALY